MIGPLILISLLAFKGFVKTATFQCKMEIKEKTYKYNKIFALGEEGR